MSTTATRAQSRFSNKTNRPMSVTVALDDLPQRRWPARSTTLVAASSGVLMFASFAPLDFGPLGWLALLPLIWLAAKPAAPTGLYKAALIGGLVWSIPQVQWLRLASWPMYFAWALLAFYMALYFPAFVALTRTAVHKLKLPLPVAAGVCWVGLEFLRSHLFSGFPWYLLGHTQHAWTTFIQIADLGGAFAISLLMASFAGLCVSAWNQRSERFPIAATTMWTVLFVAALGYGQWRLANTEFTPGPRFALVQGNYPPLMKHDPEAGPRIFEAHNRLTRVATSAQPDVIVWPETMYPYSLLTADPTLTDAEIEAHAGTIPARAFRDDSVARVMQSLAMRSGATMIIGAGRLEVTPDEMIRGNAAVHVDPERGVVDTYDKIHRVLFGEYVPFVKQLPFLSVFEFLGPSLTKGSEPKAFEVAGANLLPIICFEDTVPYVNRNAVNAAATTAAAGTNEILVNLTNDGWFHGSSELNQHLITARFRSIETRTPMVRAVNTGISAVIDGNGVVRTPEMFFDATNTIEAERYEPAIESSMTDEHGRYHKLLNAVLVADVPLDPRGSFYLLVGDALAAACLLACCYIAFVTWRSRKVSA